MERRHDLSNKQRALLDYMKKALEGRIDPFEMRDDGAFTEMFLAPQIELMEPIFDFVDTIRLSQSLENARHIPDVMLDAIANMLNKRREEGERSKGFITFIFDDFPDAGHLTIPKGTTVATRQGQEFSTDETVLLSELTIASFFDPVDYLYKIPVAATSDGIGRRFNIGAREISTIVSRSIVNLIGVTNESPFRGGKDREDNESFSIRLRTEMAIPNLGVERGYRAMIGRFDEVEDVVIVGYRHPLMKRDVIGDVSIPGVTMHEGITQKHWGSKVDVYIRGEERKEVTEKFIVQEDEDGYLYVQLTNVPLLSVRGVTISAEELGLIPEETNIERLVFNRFSVVKDEDPELIGTLDEDTKVYLPRIQNGGDFEIEEGTEVSITYSYNALLKKLDDHVYNTDDENRPPVADIRFKLGHKKYIAISIVAGLLPGSQLSLSDQLDGRMRLRDGISSVEMGQELQISDLIENLYQPIDVDAIGMVDYIELPFIALSLEHNNAIAFQCLSDEKKEIFDELFIPEGWEEYYDYYKEKLTLEDIFMVYYMLSRTPPIPKEDDLGTEVEERFLTYRALQHAYQSSGLPRILSPDLFEGTEIEYFELNHFTMRQTKELTEDDWADLDANYLSTSDIEEDIIDTEALAFFCIAFGLVANESTIVAERYLNALQTVGRGEE